MPKLTKDEGKAEGKDAGGEKPEYVGGNTMAFVTGTYEPANQAAAEELMGDIRKATKGN